MNLTSRWPEKYQSLPERQYRGGGAENAGVENAGAIKYAKLSKQKTLKIL